MIKVKAAGLMGAANVCSHNGRNPLTAMFACDETVLGQGYAVFCLFEDCHAHDIKVVKAQFEIDEELKYESLTHLFPAAAWYEREIFDMFGIEPLDHPDLRPLVLHESYPEGFYPLRKNIAVDADIHGEREFKIATAQGEGLFEVAVGPIHAGIIEPGHFRFSQAGEAILQLDAKLFYTHRGIEKAVEGKTVDEALFIVERICGACSVANTLSFCQAVEKLSDKSVPRRAWLIRTCLAELERLYNHVGDTGNLCAGVGFTVPNNIGARLKELLMRCNEQVAGNRFLRGMIVPGGVLFDIDEERRNVITSTLDTVEKEYERLVKILSEQDGFLNRVKNTGIVLKKTAMDLAMVGVGARASGFSRDSRKDLAYGIYPELSFDVITEQAGDVYARLLVREKEVKESIKLVRQILELFDSEDTTELRAADLTYRTEEGSWGVSESARGSDLHWVMLDKNQKIYRLFVRSASYPNWPALPIALQGEIIPDFPLVNKSFELCYACLDR